MKADSSRADCRQPQKTVFGEYKLSKLSLLNELKAVGGAIFGHAPSYSEMSSKISCALHQKRASDRLGCTLQAGPGPSNSERPVRTGT